MSLMWENVSKEFDFDGSWRDIYILNTDISTWQRMLDGLRASIFEVTYLCDGKKTDLPSRAEDTFPMIGERDRLLRVRFGTALANAHFFTPCEIEFDIDPREVNSQSQLDALLDFMDCLTRWVGREAILCPENSPETIIFRMPTEGQVGYRVFGGWHDWKEDRCS